MDCPSCGFDNPEGQRFCGGCGQSLRVACPACGVESPPAFRFCGQCGAQLTGPSTRESPVPDRSPRDYTPRHLADKILQSKSALEGERKQVTVLFADVKGSMELAERVDPEVWHRILDRFFQILADGVHRFEGTVNQYTGDGIMALFGAPIAHEDHAQRACYAALHLRDALKRYADELRLERGLSFSVRMGINSGEVVVAKIGDDLRMDYTAQGHTVGLAARMEQLAEPGKALLTEHTAKLAAGFFALRDLGASKVRGLMEPLHVFELEGVGGARTRLEVARARGFSRFVGRGPDLQALEAALARSREVGGQVVGVVAEAGVGKSRLCHEFAERCRARGLTVLEGHAVAHGKSVPFLPILQVFRAYFGIGEQEDARAVRDKIAGRLLLIEEGLREVLPPIFELFGVADPGQPSPRMDPEARQRQLFGVLRRLVRETGREQAGLVLIEDLHWMDGGSLGFLEQWVEAIGGARGLLLLNFRPEYRAEWMGRSYYQQLPLAPLGPEATRELVADLLGGDPSTEGLAEAIHARTAGNPFFTEEVVQSLVESGQLEGRRGSYRLVAELGALEVPVTVQSVLAARIDRLPERDKQLLQAAAVIGREFSEPVLEAVAGLAAPDLAESLRALTGAELLYEQSLYPVAEYAFRHALTQEVAYGSQLGERRARVHAAVARTIEELEADKLEERSPLLAHHWESAGEALEAARWHRRAAEWISGRDIAETLRHWQRVRTLLGATAEEPETLEHALAACIAILHWGWREGLSRAEVDEVFSQGMALARRSENLFAQAMLTEGYGAVLGMAGDIRVFEELSLEATQMAEQTGHIGLRMGTQTDVATCQMLQGRLQEALSWSERSLRLGAGDPHASVEIYGLRPYGYHRFLKGLLLAYLGRLAEAGRELQGAREFALEADDFEVLAVTYVAFVALGEIRGDRAQTLVHARQAVEVAEKIGSPLYLAMAYNSLGVAGSQNEAWSEAIEATEHSRSVASRSCMAFGEEERLATLAEATLGSGDTGRARGSAERAVALSRERGTRISQVRAELALARALLRSEGIGASAEIERELEQAGALVEETGALAFRPFVRELRAELAQVLAEEATREHELREAHRLYTEMGATGHAERLARELES